MVEKVRNWMVGLFIMTFALTVMTLFAVRV